MKITESVLRKIIKESIQEIQAQDDHFIKDIADAGNALDSLPDDVEPDDPTVQQILEVLKQEYAEKGKIYRKMKIVPYQEDRNETQYHIQIVHGPKMQNALGWFTFTGTVKEVLQDCFEDLGFN